MKEYLSSVCTYLKEELEQIRRKYFPTAKEAGVIKYDYEDLKRIFKEFNENPIDDRDLKGFPTDFAEKVHAIGGTCSSAPKDLEKRV